MPPTRYIAQPILEIDGQAVPEDLIEDIIEITVEENIHEPGMFTLVLNNDYFAGREQDRPWRHDKLFAIGKPIKIGFSASTTEATEFATEKKSYVLEAEITAIEAHFNSQSQAPIFIRGYDVAHRLHRGRYNRSFQNITDSDIVKKIAGEVGIKTNTVDSSGEPHDYVFQENQTNMEFLQERAARLGFELFVQDGKLNFRKPKAGESLTLKWLQDIDSFHVQVTSAEQVSNVEVRGWDYTKKEPIVATKNSPQLITETKHGQGKKTSTAFNGQPQNPKMIVVDQPVFSSKEAENIAQALCDELAGEFVQADAESQGNPEIRPGKTVTLEDMGKYSGKYYITIARHHYKNRTYTTEFSVRGLRGSNLRATLSPETHLQPGQTFLAGVVTNNKDPKGWGRVKVWFPTLTPKEGADAHESNWARIVTIGAGTGRGFDCLPEVNDEVLVAFEHGDIHRPYIIGSVWNGTDAPPEKVDDSVVDGKVRLRTFKTRTGHKLQFVEEDKDPTKKGIHLETVGKHKLQMNDSDKIIEIKTTDGHSTQLDDKNKKIEVTTTKGHKLLMDDNGSKKIDLISTGDINIKTGTSGTSKTIDIKAGEALITATTKILLKVGSSSIEISNSGINITSPKVSINGQTGTEVKSGMKVTVQGGMQVDIQGGTQVGIKAGASLSAQAGGSLSLQAGGSLSGQAAGSLSLNSAASFQVNAGATAGILAPLIRLNC
ncbi:VgrG-related protein [Ancylothrix sp. C2]|uniref:VgrG-related protein n=1 Tax=Ancylothrix sp. D3o TaxID=2953691 RepID=UPI0021BA684C|nr:VgrG-related protein [Ancylothrix sp. D3o]MCT7948230.1 VgrG-related protein [Ancylothrix sp. D3o]